jgi:hypothetical protein
MLAFSTMSRRNMWRSARALLAIGWVSIRAYSSGGGP